MAVSRDFGISAALSSCPFKHHRLGSSFQPSKVTFKGCYGGGLGSTWEMTQPTCLNSKGFKSNCLYNQSFKIAKDSELIPEPVSQETEGFLLDAINMSFFERLNLAWKLMFPSPSTRRYSDAKIAKQRLQMILLSDRCAVTDGAKQKIVSNIVGTLSDFVEIDSQDKVQLSVSADSETGTVYSVTVPVRRVKPEYQAVDELGAMTNVEYKDTGMSSDSVDVKFDFYIPKDTDHTDAYPVAFRFMNLFSETRRKLFDTSEYASVNKLYRGGNSDFDSFEISYYIISLFSALFL